MGKTIQCCRNCVAPKRHPGCSDTCKDYKREKEQFTREKDWLKQCNEQARDIVKSCQDINPKKRSRP